MASTPVRDGLRAVWRAPGVVLAEITWRWGFGLVLWIALMFTAIEFLDSLVVSERDLLLLGSAFPPLVVASVRHVFQGSAARILSAAAVLTPGLAILWVFACAFGRAATLSALLGQEMKWRAMGPLLGLNFLRAGLALATLLAVLGAALLVGRIPASPENVSALVLLLSALVALVGCFCSVLNWFLSLAAIFAVRDGGDTFACIAQGVDLFGREAGAMVAANTAFGLMRVVVFFAAAGFSFLAIGTLGRESLRAANVALIFIALGYFVIADWLYMARLAAYAAIAEPGHPEPVPLPPVEPVGLVPSLRDSEA